MKKGISIILLATIILLSAACGTAKGGNKNGISKQDNDYINKAIKTVNSEWKSIYSKSKNKTDKTVEIINTRVIHIKKNNTQEFKDVEAVVEFDLLTDYYGSSPYYSNIRKNNSVVFYKDGTGKLIDIFQLYRQKTFITDYSDIIETVSEYGTAFNTEKIKTAKATPEHEKYITDAVKQIQSARENGDAQANNDDGTLKIIHTKLLYINRQSKYPKFEKYFDDIDAIVEFELYSDYFGSAPYYVNTGTDNTVIFYKDGKTEISSDYLRKVSNATYDFDFSDLFTDVLDFGAAYNASLSPENADIP